MMPTLNIAAWQNSLKMMEDSIAEAKNQLELYENVWVDLLEGEAPPIKRSGSLERLDGRLNAWDDRLRAAAELADELDQALIEREGMVGRWREIIRGRIEAYRKLANDSTSNQD